MTEPTTDPIRVGVSTCLLGENVRFDGGHKNDRFVSVLLAEHFTFVPVCPELEAGMGVPREAVRLVGDAAAPKMLGVRSKDDWTGRMNRYSRARVKRDDLADLSGYILKSKSPSCGFQRVKVYGDGGMPTKSGVGLFARALLDAHPLLPVEEEGRLNDPLLRENFVVRVFAYDRLRRLFASRYNRAELIRFHERHKYLLLAHSPKHARELGRLVADLKKVPPAEMRERYCETFMQALAFKATVGKNVNVLLHILGFLREHLSDAARSDVLQVIEDYRNRLVPLVAPISLLRHYVTTNEVDWIRDQVYLEPHPRELMLRNHV